MRWQTRWPGTGKSWRVTKPMHSLPGKTRRNQISPRARNRGSGLSMVVTRIPVLG
jgi:hypothetical protein